MKSEEGGRKREGRGQLLGRLRLKEKQLSDDLFCEDNTQANVFFFEFPTLVFNVHFLKSTHFPYVLYLV